MAANGEVSVSPRQTADPLESTPSGSRIARWAPVATIVVLAAVAARQPLWRDELATLSFARLDVGDLADAVRHVDVVLLPYYLLSHVCVAVLGEWALRVPSIVAAAAVVGLVGTVARREWGERAGLAAAWAVALNPLAVTMGSTARPYALATAGVASAALLVQSALVTGGRLRWFGYATVVAATAFAHVFAILAALPTGLWALRARRRRKVATVASLAGALLVVLPFALVAAGQRGQVAWIRVDGVRGAVGALASLVLYRSDNSARVPELLALALLTGAVVLALVARTRVELVRTLPATCAATGIAVVPWGLLLVASWVASPLLRTTYLAPSVVGLGLLVGLVWGTPPRTRTRHRRTAAVVASALVVAMGAVVVGQLLRAPWRVDDFAGAVGAVARSARVGDTMVVVQLENEVGVASGVARASGDEAYDDELERALPAGEQPVVDVRRITSVSPLRSVEDDGSADAVDGAGRAWFVYTRGALDDAARDLVAAEGLDCGPLEEDAGARHGLLVVAPARCGG